MTTTYTQYNYCTNGQEKTIVCKMNEQNNAHYKLHCNVKVTNV